MIGTEHIDVGLVPKTFGHYVENTGNDDLIFLEMFKGDRLMDLSLSDWSAIHRLS